MATSFDWDAGSLRVRFRVEQNGNVGIQSLNLDNEQHIEEPALPMQQGRLTGDGNYNEAKTSKALISSYISREAKYVKHEFSTSQGAYHCAVETIDEARALRMVIKFTVYEGIPVLRATNTITNESTSSRILTSLPTLAVGSLTGKSERWWQDWKLSFANNSWFREAQWTDRSLPDIGIDVNKIGCPASWSTFSLSSLGTMSTSTYLPMGILKKVTGTPETWLWQIEHNGSWKWEIGDWRNDVYLALSGPTNNDHHWREELKPGESFTSVPVSLCHVQADVDTAFQALTQYRRRIRRPHKDNINAPVIFNDYMNCLMGDPNEEKIKALIEPALSLGAEYFVIDAGWYADDGNWWNDIGLWQPSRKRFPNGFDVLLRHIRDNGLIPGVWVEPESIGIQSPMAERLPPEAFYQQSGQRIVERDRFQLDFRHPEVRSHLTQVIERLIADYGIGYFKFDYNIEISQGTDHNSSSPGAGQLDHNRAYLSWVSSLLDKHPDLVIENCSSGAQRMDYAQMSVHPIQSTSDQEDPYLYAPIAAAVFSAVTPEQSATWAYPQPDWSVEKNAFTMVNALLGRIHLSGRIDKMAGDQLAIVNEGIELYKSFIRKDIPTSVPFWPLGFPMWHDDWLALGSLCSAADGREHAYLAVWRRGGPSTCDVPLSGLPKSGMKGVQVGVQLLYPPSAPGTGFEISEGNVLRLTLPMDEPCARLFKLTCGRG